MRRCLLTAILLACALVAPAAARAEGGPLAPVAARRTHLAQASAAVTADPAGDPQITQWLAVARAYWAASPNCPSGISLQRAQWLPDPGIWAAAVQGGCAIAFDPDFYPAPAGYDAGWWRAAMCSVVAHEYGHLLGLGHVDDPTKLMNAVTPINFVPGCPTWGPSTVPAPAQAAPATPRSRTRTASKASKRKTCAARTRRTKASRSCKASVKRRSRR